MRSFDKTYPTFSHFSSIYECQNLHFSNKIAHIKSHFSKFCQKSITSQDFHTLSRLARNNTLNTWIGGSKMQPIFPKELTKRTQLIYYHFTTIRTERGSFRAIRAVFSEIIFFGENTKNYVC